MRLCVRTYFHWSFGGVCVRGRSMCESRRRMCVVTRGIYFIGCCEPTDTFASAKSRRTLTQDSERVGLSWTPYCLGIQSTYAACGLTRSAYDATHRKFSPPYLGFTPSVRAGFTPSVRAIILGPTRVHPAVARRPSGRPSGRHSPCFECFEKKFRKAETTYSHTTPLRKQG